VTDIRDVIGKRRNADYRDVIGKRRNGQTSRQSKSFTSFHSCTMDAPGKVYFNSPLSRRPSPDHRPRKGGWPDEGSCRVFPGKHRIIRDHCKSPPRSVEFGASGNLGDSEGQVVRARRVLQGRRKSQIEGSCCVFPWKCCIIRGQSKVPSGSEEDGTVPVATKAARVLEDPVCS